MLTEANYPLYNPEFWGGIECTVNRVGNHYRDQLHDLGHYRRMDDIRQIARLGIKKLRYPVLWENHEDCAGKHINWERTSFALQQICKEGIEPIVGLLHHGSGPQFTDLLDSDFPKKLAAYAAQVAQQFPWVEYYTPVNEPLTTARFSGLYGYWYPHRKDEKSFVIMLLNQVKGIILSMQAIRKINANAKLVQTEDLGKVHSSPALAYQAEYENQRRWLTYDLLCGQFTPHHPFWTRFLELGIPETDLQFFSENVCKPEIAGFNYYITSERYLDDQLNNYPVYDHGGNGRHKYADTERVRKGRLDGLEKLLEEAWNRYKLPMAITECHLSCTREEQLRWLKENWDNCCQLNKKGIPVKAFTAWALLGAYDWNHLLCCRHMQYEPGAFDVSNGVLRPTLLAKLLSRLGSPGSFSHPVMDNKGWWHAAEGNDQKNENFLLLVNLAANGDRTPEVQQVCNGRRLSSKVYECEASLDAQHRPWGIVIHAEDGLLINYHNYIKIDNFARLHHIPVMIIRALPLGEYNPHHLTVINDDADELSFANRALDLLLDAEKGVWVLSKKSMRNMPVHEFMAENKLS